MKITSKVKYGHYFRVGAELIHIPAQMVVDVTKAQLAELEKQAVFEKAVDAGHIVVGGKKKKKPDVVDDNTDG